MYGHVNKTKTIIVVVATIPFIYPFVFLVATALKPITEFNNDAVGYPRHPTFDNISTAWHEADLGLAMIHSALAVGIGVFVTVFISTAGAYWFLRHSGRVAKVVWITLLCSMAIPPPVFIIPLFVMLSNRGLTNNLLVLGFVYGAWNSGFGMYMMHAYYKGIPGEVTEAARVDGASVIQQFFRIILPLSKPALATVGALTFLWSWNDLLLSVVLIQDPGKRPITAGVALLGDQYSTNTTGLAAAVLIALVPVLAIFLFGQRFIARGIAAGVGK